MSMGATGEFPASPSKTLLVGVSGSGNSCLSKDPLTEPAAEEARVELARDREGSLRVSATEMVFPPPLVLHLRENEGNRVPIRDAISVMLESAARRLLATGFGAKSPSP